MLWNLVPHSSLKPYLSKRVSLRLVACFIILQIQLFLKVTGTTTRENMDTIQKLLNSAVGDYLRKYDQVSDFSSSFVCVKIHVNAQFVSESSAWKILKSHSSRNLCLHLIFTIHRHTSNSIV